MLAKIDIKIAQDWSDLIKKYQKFNHVIDYGIGLSRYIKGYASDRYDFKDSGSIIVYNDIVGDPDSASSVSGNLIESTLPWTKQLRKDLSELNVVALSLQSNHGSLKPHVDGQESADTLYHCKLNYIIDNYNANSYVTDGSKVGTYPSHKNTAWLLDTTKLHWVSGVGQRYVFQITFHQKHSEVLDWFNSHPPLSYQ